MTDGQLPTEFYWAVTDLGMFRGLFPWDQREDAVEHASHYDDGKVVACVVQGTINLAAPQ